jgi:hypothetical protein
MEKTKLDKFLDLLLILGVILFFVNAFLFIKSVFFRSTIEPVDVGVTIEYNTNNIDTGLTSMQDNNIINNKIQDSSTLNFKYPSFK